MERLEDNQAAPPPAEGQALHPDLSRHGEAARQVLAHSLSRDLVKECQEADIIIAALGQPNFVKAEMVKEGAVVIDVGTTRVPDATKKSGFKLTGDVKFDEVAPKCSFITPVPGGVGPMTIVSLMKNTLLAGKKAIYQ
jgi:methylenetetrahydrofolate dehydrogenase (NADP+)/methenyltetrahydrofolate cyclohydrolase